MSEESKQNKPGQAALKNMLLLKNESAVFKVPKVPKKNNIRKTKVLDEEVYVEGIAKIIQRDFFPDLEKLKAQNEFLEATENKDYVKLREIARKYSGTRPPTEPYNSPATFDTPDVDRPYSPSAPTVREQRLDSDSESTVSDKKKDIIDNHSLDSFLSNHTSEDNASYDRVISLEQKKRANKLGPQLEAEVTSAAIADAALALPSIEQQADQTNKPFELDTWRYKARNYIMYVPAGAASQRPPPKPELIHQNTRLVADPFDQIKNKEAISAIAKTQDASTAGKIGVDGSSAAGGGGAGAGGAEEARGLVGTPSPRPGALHSPLMTWGEIEGTPFRLDGGDTPLPAVGAGAAYRMLEGGARERIALQLAERAAKRRRPTTPRPTVHTPRTNTERLASMSPAARKLAAKHLLSPRLTPLALCVSRGSPRPLKSPLVATPNSKKRPPTPSSSGNVNANVTVNNITDNLLQINVAKRTRLKASDFFQ